MISLQNLLEGVNKIVSLAGSTVLHFPDVKAVIDSAISTLHPGDQDEAKQTIEDMLSDTEEHRERVRAKLEALANQSG